MFNKEDHIVPISSDSVEDVNVLVQGLLSKKDQLHQDLTSLVSKYYESHTKNTLNKSLTQEQNI
jgi:hypothetical protein